MYITVAARVCDCLVQAQHTLAGELVWSYVAEHGLLEIGPACGLGELAELEALMASQRLRIELEGDGEPAPYIDGQEDTQASWPWSLAPLL